MSLFSDAWEFLTTADNWHGSNGILSLTWSHLRVAIISVLVAAAVAIPPAVWLAHKDALPVISVAFANLGRAIPSFAIIVLVVPFSIRFGFGLGFWPTAVALVALGIPPIFTNTYAGIAGTPATQIEAAAGIGMTGTEILCRVEIPAALPLLMAGLRIAAVQIVATATLGALVGYQCLGTYIVQGVASPEAYAGSLIGGALLVAALAILVEVAMNRLEKSLTPWRGALR